MASPFDALDAALQSTIDGAFGEAIRIVPRGTVASQYAGPQPDPLRPIRDVRGTFSLAPDIETPAGQRTGTELNGVTVFAHSRAEVWLDAAVVAGLGYEIKRGDGVALLDQPGQPRYTVVRLAPTDQGDVALLLAATEAL